MCLTTPAKVIKIKNKKAVIKAAGKPTEINTSLITGLKTDDWILYINNLAIKKISKKEAQEILELLESPRRRIDRSKLSKKFKKIIQSSKSGNLTKKEVIYLLKTQGTEEKTLFFEADTMRRAYIKDFICIHGIIEFSNFCKNDCSYCGLRKENKTLPRYRMSVNEIVKSAKMAVKNRGYKLLVLQSGEDYFYTDKMLEDIVKKIKQKNKVFIFLSIGERGYECYKRLKKAGASGVLLRFETSNPNIFKSLHQNGKNLKNRFLHLNFLKKLGYFIATGFMAGLPGQTEKDLAKDIITTKKFANMASIGPFIPCGNTPLAESLQSDAQINFKIISILRLLMKDSRIPVSTALETLSGEKGRKKALLSGANSLMFNLTPKKYRHLYKIYPNKFYQSGTIWQKYGLFKREESYKMLEERIEKEISAK